MPASLYDDAAVYDILHAPGTAGDASGLEATRDRFVQGQARRKHWLEPACGTARILRVLASRGHRVAGFDLNPGMIAYANACLSRSAARTKARATLFVADMTDFARCLAPASVGFAFNPINTIRHLATDAAMLAHFEQIARVLAPGGAYAVGISLSKYGLEAPTEDVWQGRRGKTHVHQFVQYEPPDAGRNERVISHLTVTRNGKASHHDSVYHLRCYDAKQWKRLLDRSPLRVLATCDDQGADFTPPPFGYAVHVLAHRA